MEITALGRMASRAGGGKGMIRDPETLRRLWTEEERSAGISGWDFSPFAGRMEEDTDFGWDLRAEIKDRLRPDSRILDIDTGGGEFLLSLGHPPQLCAATEGYEPNIELCRRKLAPLGIDFHAAAGDGPLPFEDEAFDLVINRHGSFHPGEIYRVLKPGGFFITQQVGARNDRELVELLLPGGPLPYPDQEASVIEGKFRAAGFHILRTAEAFRPISFFDTGALIRFARIIEWEFSGFSVEGCFERLLEAESRIARDGFIGGTTHRIFLEARKGD